MKVKPDFQKATKEDLYIWNLARNLLYAKRSKRQAMKLENENDIESIKNSWWARGEENAAHNTFYNAKEWLRYD